MSKFSTLGDALTALHNSMHAVNFIDGENAERRQPYRELHARAAGMLNHFQKAGASAGGEMIILVDRNEQFIDAFWAGILGNIILVPIAPGTTDEHRLKFFRVLEKLQRPCLCTDSAIFARLAAFAADQGLTAAIERIRPATVMLDRLEDISTPGRESPAQPDDIAFVQYSSGSTSEPKGVALTHRNLLTNIRAISAAIHIDGNDTTLSWMPLTHDMGLIGFHLTPLLADAEQYLMPTALFARRPQIWLGKASAHKATILCSPNFGYRHFLKTFKPENAQSLDLSSVRIVFNGAEPISTALSGEFTEAMTPYGLKSSAMFPVYGLAEASLAVTFPQPGSGCRTMSVRRSALTPGAAVQRVDAGVAHGAAFAVVGKAIADCEVRIADDMHNALPDFTVGHVLIRGDNVTRGYYRDPVSTQAAVKDGWLDTGDLGFNSPDGLVITGRAKEIIFVSGQNYYPHDIDAIVEKHAGVELGKVAACGARPEDAAEDHVLVFVQHRGDAGEFVAVAAAVRKAVNEFAGITVTEVIPVERMPKTTSGKIQRFKLAESYLRGEFAETLETLHRLARPSGAPGEAAHSEVERHLREICNALLPDRSIGLNDNIFELGTSSLTLAQIYERIEAIYPGQLEVTDFFDYPTIAELAAYLESRLQSA